MKLISDNPTVRRLPLDYQPAVATELELAKTVIRLRHLGGVNVFTVDKAAQHLLQRGFSEEQVARILQQSVTRRPLLLLLAITAAVFFLLGTQL